MAPKKKGKKKSKKPKISKEEKAKLKLEKSCKELTGHLDLYQSFLERLNTWLSENGLKAEELFRKFDTNQDGLLTYDEFKAGMLDLDVPCNSIELHVLTVQLDKDANGRIDYLEFSKGLSFPDDSNETNDGPVLRITKEEIKSCPCCNVGLWKPYVEPAPRYIKVLFKMVTFENIRNYPGHFTKVVHSHIYVYGLILLIKEETELTTTKMRLYLNKTSESDLLRSDKTLEEYGFKGSTRDNPQEVLLFYDFATEVQDCPLVNCDYYFSS